MSVIIRLQNLPWSANAADIRSFFSGLSIPEGGVHIVGGEQGDAFIAFSTDEDARQAMMKDGGKIKEIQVKLLLSSRSEMHKVIEAARQGFSILQLQPQLQTPVTTASQSSASVSLNSFLPHAGLSAYQGLPSSLSSIPGLGGIPGLGVLSDANPQPAVIEPPTPINDLDKSMNLDAKTKDRRVRSRSKSRDRDKRDRRKDRRSRSRERSRERRRRDRTRSRSRERRDRKRKDRSRSRDRDKRRSRESKKPEDRKLENDPKNELSPQTYSINTNGRDIQPLMKQTNQTNQPNNWMPQNHAQNQNTTATQNATPQNNFMQQMNQRVLTDEMVARIYDLGNKRDPSAFQRGAESPIVIQENRDIRDARNDRNSVASGTCVQLRNIPPVVGYGEIRKFLYGTHISTEGIKMIHDITGRRCGIAFVRFNHDDGKKKALSFNGREIRGQSIMITHLPDEHYEKAIDGKQLPPSLARTYLNQTDNDNDDAESSKSLVIVENDEKEEFFPVLRLKDMPNYTKELDIIKKYSEYTILSIMLFDNRENKTKTAYVQFAKPEDAKAAYELKDRYIGRTQITLSKCTKTEYEMVKANDMEDNIEDETNQQSPPQAEVPRDPRQRRNPPNNPKDRQIEPLMNPLMPSVRMPSMGYPIPNGPLSGLALQGGLLPRPSFPAQNMHGDPRNSWRPSIRPGQDNVMHSDDDPADCILIKGLPVMATDRTILDIFSDVGVIPARIHLMLDIEGRPSGDCFCEFRSTGEAMRATSKNLMPFGNGTLSVQLVNHSVVDEALDGPKNDNLNNFGGAGYRGRGGPRSGRGRGDFTMRGRGDYNSTYSSNYDSGFRSRGSMSILNKVRGLINRGGMGRGARGGFGEGYNRPMPQPLIGDVPGLIPNPIPGPISAQGPENFGAPGCVVAMENVPFRAGVEEVLNFFSGFNLTPDDVMRRYNDRGQPTGDARVAFRTPDDALRAVQELNMCPIRERKVTLAII